MKLSQHLKFSKFLIESKSPGSIYRVMDIEELVHLLRDKEWELTDNKFENIEDLQNYFINMIDSYVYHISCEKECINCYQRQIQRCAAGCMAFVQRQLELISEIKICHCLETRGQDY